jgi:prepilin-type N-terminal cleavage/methylation domain-containing protein
MRPPRFGKQERGFTLIEMLASLGIFLLVTGAAFTLLTSSQQRYRTESEVLTSFQEARLGLDQMVRDINDAGFPPASFANVDPTKVTSAPFGWSPGYTMIPPSPCQIGTGGGGTCFSPTDFDIIVETEPNPNDPACTPNCSVQWIRYQLQGTTLMRGMVPKQASHDPAVDTSAAGVLVPFVQNVVNNSPTLQIGQFQLDATYPAVFPGGAAVPIFQYTCDTPSAPQNPPQPCPLAGADDAPANIRDVAITLIVAAPLPDSTTGQPRLVQLEGRGRRMNPSQ